MLLTALQPPPPTPHTMMRGFNSLSSGALRLIVICQASRNSRYSSASVVPDPWTPRRRTRRPRYFAARPAVAGRFASIRESLAPNSRSFPLTIYPLASCSRPFPSPPAPRDEARNIRAPRPADRRAIPPPRRKRGCARAREDRRRRSGVRRGPGRRECGARHSAAPVSWQAPPVRTMRRLGLAG